MSLQDLEPLDYRSLDPAVTKAIKSLPRVPNQAQYSTSDQLKHLYDVASRLGLYDARDVLKSIIK